MRRNVDQKIGSNVIIRFNKKSDISQTLELLGVKETVLMPKADLSKDKLTFERDSSSLEGIFTVTDRFVSCECNGKTRFGWTKMAFIDKDISFIIFDNKW